MNRIQKFEEFEKTNEALKERFPKKVFGKVTDPEEPMKRKLTKEETSFMFRNFKNHSWSGVDAQGRIILGGGESPRGKFYITEDDLEKFMKEEKGGGNRHVGTKSPLKINEETSSSDADKIKHSVETEWHYSILTKFGYKPLDKVKTGLVRSYVYRNSEGHEIECSTGYSADYWTDKDNGGRGYWNSLENHLKELSKNNT